MNTSLGERIAGLRKKYNLSQTELAKRLGVTFQAISKWETGVAYPDIEHLPLLSKIFNVSVDYILNFENSIDTKNPYNKKYDSKEYYWGEVPNDGCFEVMKLMPPTKRLKLLDIGCGEGKDSVFFARNGYNVDAFDLSHKGIEKTKLLAKKANVEVNAFVANMNEYRLSENYDIIYSSGALHYIPDNLRQEIFYNYINHTNNGGIHVLNAFVKKSFIDKAPDDEDYAYSYKSGELFTYYNDFEILKCDEFIFNCMSSGVAHKHCMNILVAKKI